MMRLRHVRLRGNDQWKSWAFTLVSCFLFYINSNLSIFCSLNMCICCTFCPITVACNVVEDVIAAVLVLLLWSVCYLLRSPVLWVYCCVLLLSFPSPTTRFSERQSVRETALLVFFPLSNVSHSTSQISRRGFSTSSTKKDKGSFKFRLYSADSRVKEWIFL